MDVNLRSNEKMKIAIAQTMNELAPIIKASENRMPVENILTYANEIGIVSFTLHINV